MDQELIAYLDERFRETAQKIEDLREATVGRFEQIDGRFEQMDGRFEQMDGRFEQINGRFEQIDGRLEQMEGRFEQMEGRFEQIDDRFERVDGRFEQIDGRFEQIDGRFEQIDGRFEQIDGRLKSADSRFDRVETTIRNTQVLVEGLRGDIQLLSEGVMGIDEKLGSFRAEVAKDFGMTRGLINPPYLELHSRVQALESWRERRERDPLDLIREKFGRKP
jgi:chromosome segregation ATPase